MTSEMMLRTAGMVSGSMSLRANAAAACSAVFLAKRAAVFQRQPHPPVERQDHEAVLVLAENPPYRRAVHLHVDGAPEAIDGVCEVEALDPLGKLLADAMGHEDEVGDADAVLVRLACRAHPCPAAVEGFQCCGRTQLVGRLGLLVDAIPRLPVESPRHGDANGKPLMIFCTGFLP